MIYDFIFVVLVYRNTDDLKDFFANLKISNTKTIVVNSFFDELSDNEFNKIAVINKADFISVPNNGYGTGNNIGCEHALKNYQFKYLIISNADIILKQMRIEDLSNTLITAPKIITARGKKQNPAKPYDNPLAEWLIYKSFTNNIPILLWCSLVITRLLREFFFITNKFGCNRIYEVHGAFIIIPYNILKKLHPLFNEKMFLFSEEDHLARLTKKHCIMKEYNSKVIVFHKEDGSVNLLDKIPSDLEKMSFLTYYNSWKNSEY